MCMLYVVETWDNALTLCGPDGSVKDTFMCHIASTLEAALDFCEANNNMAGKQQNWHWAISMWRTDDNHALDRLTYKHYTRALEECDSDGINVLKSDQYKLDEPVSEDDDDDSLILEWKDDSADEIESSTSNQEFYIQTLISQLEDIKDNLKDIKKNISKNRKKK